MTYEVSTGSVDVGQPSSIEPSLNELVERIPACPKPMAEVVPKPVGLEPSSDREDPIFATRADRAREVRKLVRWRRSLRRKLGESSTGKSARSVQETLRVVRRAMITLIGTDDPRPTLRDPRGFTGLRLKKKKAQEKCLAHDLTEEFNSFRGKPPVDELGLTDEEMADYSKEWDVWDRYVEDREGNPDDGGYFERKNNEAENFQRSYLDWYSQRKTK